MSESFACKGKVEYSGNMGGGGGYFYGVLYREELMQ